MPLETPRSTPDAPGNKLLTQFRNTLDKRWAEFDAATLREAGGIEVVRNMHADFQKAKSTFDVAKGVLLSLKNDDELKQQLNVPGKLSATVSDLETYFSTLNAQDKQKDYNKVVANTIADLTSLKAQMSGGFDDARRAEQARADANTPIPGNPASSNPLASLEASVPAVATMVSGLGATAASTGLVSEGWFKTKVKGWVTDFEGWLTNLLPDGPFREKITGFFSFLKIKLGITKPAENTGVPELSQTEKIHGPKGAEKVFKILLLRNYIGEKDRELQEYFTDEKILKRSIKNLTALLNEHSGNNSNLAKAIGFEESQGDKVQRAITLLLSGKTRAEMKSMGIKDAEDQPIGKLFSVTAKYIEMLERVKSKGKDLDVKDMSFKDGTIDQNISEFVGEKKEMLLALKERFGGFSPKLLGLLHTKYSTTPISEDQKFETIIGALEGPEKEFLTKTLSDYAKKLPAFLESLSFGSEKSAKVIREYMKKPGITYADAIDFFILTGGRTDNLNSFEKGQAMIRLVVMLRNSKIEDGYLYGAELAQAVLKDSREMTLPLEVKVLLIDIKDLLEDIVIKAGKEAVGLVRGIFNSAPFFTTGAGAAAAGLLLLAFKLTPIGRVATTFGWLITATGLAGAFAAYKLTDDGKVVDAKTGEVKADVEKLAEEYRKNTPKA